MANGVDRRSEIDTETVRALLLINGGGAVALLSLLPSVLPKPELKAFVFYVFVGVIILMIGLVSAVIHNRLRRVCSLVYEHHNMKPPSGKLFGRQLKEPTCCVASSIFMWFSIGAFFAAGTLVAVVGMTTL